MMSAGRAAAGRTTAGGSTAGASATGGTATGRAATGRAAAGRAAAGRFLISTGGTRTVAVVSMGCGILHTSVLVRACSIRTFFPVLGCILLPCSVVCMSMRNGHSSNISADITVGIYIIVIHMGCGILHTSVLIRACRIRTFFPVLGGIMSPYSICMCMY